MTDTNGIAGESHRTPGPWDIIGSCDWTVDTDSGNTFVHIGPIDGDPVAIAIVADCWCMDDTLDANARMIAAAPELLTKGQALVDALDKIRFTNCNEALEEFRAAIAKAGGQS